jgi:hypothetical protein
LDGERIKVIADPAVFSAVRCKMVDVVFPETVIFPRRLPLPGWISGTKLPVIGFSDSPGIA